MNHEDEFKNKANMQESKKECLSKLWQCRASFFRLSGFQTIDYCGFPFTIQERT